MRREPPDRGGYADDGGSAFIDRELYLPHQWIDDRPRCEATGIPASVEFAAKPRLARQMIEPALDAGAPSGWVTGDEVYGGDRHLRTWLESREQPFVLAVARNEPLWWQGPKTVKAEVIARSLVPSAWNACRRDLAPRGAPLRLGTGAARCGGCN